jgi:ribonucleoside-triphosphate reductase
MSRGDSKGRVFTFPIPTYNITKDFDWDSPITQKIFEMTAKYGVPYFSNFVNSDMKPEDVRSMCCRLRIDNRELRKRGGGFFGANPLTGSIGVVTLNLPRIGYLAKDEDEFFERLEALMEIAKESLEIKRKGLENFTEVGLYPYSRRYLVGVKEGFRKYWKNHFSTIGLVGMNEAILNLFGFDIVSQDGWEFAVKVLTFMREKLADFQEETGNIYNLEATPAEGTSYRLARIDKRRYPDIIAANEKHVSKGAEPFYTNSSQLPVDFEGDLFEALEHQERVQTLYTGGTVLHIFLGERLHSWRATAELIRRIAWNSHLPYFTLTPTFSICPTHGYTSGEQKQCPICGADCEVYSRVVGYLRPVDQWNAGKQAEFDIRKTFDKSVVVAASAQPIPA